jgi:hypothetical protein
VSAGRTKRWSGSTSAPSLDEAGDIVCAPRNKTNRHTSVFAYHDWFIANHPPIRVA